MLDVDPVEVNMQARRLLEPRRRADGRVWLAGTDRVLAHFGLDARDYLADGEWGAYARDIADALHQIKDEIVAELEGTA